MHLLQNIPLLAGLAAALSIPPHQLQRRDPTANDIKVAELSFAGAGCGASTAGLNASVVDAATFRVPRIIFAAKAGEAGAKVVETKSNCQLTLRVTHPAGWQFSVAKADYYGRVHLPQGSEATSISTYSFSGVTNKLTKQYYFDGPFDGLYYRNDRWVGDTGRLWSACGTGATLTINTEARVAPIGGGTSKPASIEVYNLLGERLGISWKKCT